jgi:hypothetical protein
VVFSRDSLCLQAVGTPGMLCFPVASDRQSVPLLPSFPKIQGPRWRLQVNTTSSSSLRSNHRRNKIHFCRPEFRFCPGLISCFSTSISPCHCLSLE